MKSFISSLGGKEIFFNVGHFEISGFFKYREQWWYFSLSDVRYKLTPGFLIRKAKNNNDYSGETNQYISCDDKEKFVQKFINIVVAQSKGRTL